MSQENVEQLRSGFQLWNVALNEPDEATWRAISAALSGAYHAEAQVDFSRTLPDFPTTDPRQASKPLWWIQIGSMAGTTITLPSAALRAANLQLLGSGQGSRTTAEIVAELPGLADQITAGTFVVDPLSASLSEVESAWNTPTAPGQRIVFTT